MLGFTRAHRPSILTLFSFHPSCAFVTYEKMESADQAVAEVGTSQICSPHPSCHPHIFSLKYWEPGGNYFLLTESLPVHARNVFSGPQSVARVATVGIPPLLCLQCFSPSFASSPLLPQLNGTQVESVQLKVSIARKQPMLDAATGKSVWGSLGKNGFFLCPTAHPSCLFPARPRILRS